MIYSKLFHFDGVNICFDNMKIDPGDCIVLYSHGYSIAYIKQINTKSIKCDQIIDNGINSKIVSFVYV